MRKRSSRRKWTSTRRRSSGWATRCRRRSPTTRRTEATLTPTAKAAREKDLGGKQQAYQQHVQELEQTAQQREAELVRPIMEQINKIIEQIRTENGYSFILDAGSQAGVVVAADSSLDITDQVIKRSSGRGARRNEGIADRRRRRLQRRGPLARPRRSRPAFRVPSRLLTDLDHSARDFNSLGGVSESALTAEAVAHLVGGRLRGDAVGARGARGGARPRRRPRS